MAASASPVTVTIKPVPPSTIPTRSFGKAVVTGEKRQTTDLGEAQELPVDHTRSAPAAVDGDTGSSYARQGLRRASWAGPNTTPSTPTGPNRFTELLPPDWRGPHLVRAQGCHGRGAWAWVPQSSPGSLPASRPRLAESLLTDVREMVERELAKRDGQAERRSGLTEELTKLRKELACQKQELQTQKIQIDFQREQMEALAANAQGWQSKAMQTSAEEREAIIEEVRSACIDLVSSLAARVRDLIHSEREHRSVALHGVRESIQCMLEDRIRRQCREERTARLEELSEMHSALLNRLDEERTTLLEHMRGLALAVELGFKNGPVEDHENMPSTPTQIHSDTTKGSLPSLLHRIATLQFSSFRPERNPQDIYANRGLEVPRGAVLQNAMEHLAEKSLLPSDLALCISALRDTKTDDNPFAGLRNDGEEIREQSDSAGGMTRTLAGSPGHNCGLDNTLDHAKQNANQEHFVVDAFSCEQQLEKMIGTGRVEGCSSSHLESIAEEMQTEATELDIQSE